MTRHSTQYSRHPLRRLVVATTSAVAAILLAVGPAAAGWAHGGDEPATAFDLVRQAIALTVNKPGDTMTIEDKINDAAESDDTARVQMPLIEQAKNALDAGDLHQTRALLEQAIGTRVHTGNTDPVVIGMVPPAATGEDTGTVAAIDALRGRSGLHAVDWTLLAIGMVAAATGIALSFRLRPHADHASEGKVAR